MGWAYHRPLTTTESGGRHTVTRTTEYISTIFDVATTKVITSTASTTTATVTTKEVDVDVKTVVSTTTTATTALPYTVSLITYTTQTSVSTATLSTTQTNTEVFLGTYSVPIENIAAAETHGLERRAPSTFCLAYKIACEDECSKVSSRRKSWLCEKDETSTYSLGCVCRNGLVETQHALEAIAEDRKIHSISQTGSTSTKYITASRTTTVPTDTLTTRMVTRTAEVRLTTTTSTTSTLTTGAETHFTGRLTPVKTELISTHVVSTTATTTTTRRIVTTTQIVLVATGRAFGFDVETGVYVGTVGKPVSGAVALLREGGDKETEDVIFMAIRDDASGVYKLAVYGDPTTTFLNFATTQTVFEEGSKAGAFAFFSDYTTCGEAGLLPAPVTNDAEGCEAYVISPLAVDLTLPAAVVLQPFWYNPLGSTPTTFSGIWGSWVNLQKQLLHIADKEAFMESQPTAEMNWVELKFPF